MQINFCPTCAGPMRTQFVHDRERPVCERCGQIFFRDPKVTVGVLVEHQGRLLLVQRRYNPGQGQWCPPCGFVDPGEHPKDAAIREVAEETGITITITGLLDIYTYDDDPRGGGIFLVYTGEPLADTDPTPGDDAIAAAFVPLDELPPLSFHLHQRAIAAWRAKRGA
ncbi:MAG: hypothetical protein KatS3mg057_2738 [Herpetosiphonaceae bacterium]|nr:MAG: hypothetical protein KatS3mg057_2738 [Herpetosiphonaceae bacterium]